MTTGVAATKTGHSAICIELDERYFELGRSMLEAATAQRVLV
jgi:DNA modification methylase